MTRPSSTRTEQERYDDVTLIWIEEWLRDILAGLAVMKEMVDVTPTKSLILSSLKTSFVDLIIGTEELIGKVEES